MRVTRSTTRANAARRVKSSFATRSNGVQRTRRAVCEASSSTWWKPETARPKNTSYTKLKLQELTQLLKARGLDSPEMLCRNALQIQDQQHAHDPFPFLSLPLELREMIYDYALAPEQRSEGIPYDPKAFNPCLPALTRVNSQIRKESLARYFACNDVGLSIMICEAHGPEERHAGIRHDSYRTLQRLSAHAHLFRRLVITLCFYIDAASFDITFDHPEDYDKPQLVLLRMDWKVNPTPHWVMACFFPGPRIKNTSDAEQRFLQLVEHMVSDRVLLNVTRILEESKNPFVLTPENAQWLAQKLLIKVHRQDIYRQF